MDRLETELQHILKMLEPPFFNGWKAAMWHKAKRLAQTEPDEFAKLPSMLTAEIERCRITPAAQ